MTRGSNQHNNEETVVTIEAKTRPNYRHIQQRQVKKPDDRTDEAKNEKESGRALDLGFVESPSIL